MTHQLLQKEFCKNSRCIYYLLRNQKNIAIHDKRKKRFKCKSCKKTWSAHKDQIYYGLRSEKTKIDRCLELLKHGYGVRYIARLIQVSPSTVMRWKKRVKKSNQSINNQ